MLNIHGDVRVDGMETVMSMFSQPTLNLITDLKPSMSSTAYFTMSTQLPHLRLSAVGMFDAIFNTHVKAQFEVNVAERKMKLVIEPPQEDYTVAKFQITPITHIEVFPDSPA